MSKPGLKFIFFGLVLFIAVFCRKTNISDWPSYTTANTSKGLAGNNINAIAIDSINNKWVGTNYGVNKFDGTHWTTYNTQNGLVNNIVHAIKIDASGNIWVGTSGGLSEFNGTSWISYVDTINLHEINIIYKHSSKNDSTKYSEPYLKTENLCIYAIDFDNSGNIWVATNVGVSEFKNSQWTNYLDTVSGDTLRSYSIAVDASNTKWIGTTFGVAIANYPIADTIQNFLTKTNGLINNAVSCISIDKKTGNKWFGTVGGVSEYTGKLWFNYSDSNGLVSNWVPTIAFDSQGNKWFGTGGGISRYNGVNWTTYTTDNGLISSLVNAIAFDKQGNAWVGTTQGITKILAQN